MTTNQNLNNLLFLLASSSLAMACDLGTGDDDDTGGNSTAGTADDGDDGDDGMSTGGDGSMTTTAGDDNMPDSGDSGDTAEDGSSGGSDTATTGAEYGVCFDYAKTAAECDDMVDQTEQYMLCEDLLDYYASYGEGCLGAAEEFYACVAQLDCRTFNSEDGCEKEAAAVDVACVEDTGSSGGSESGTAG